MTIIKACHSKWPMPEGIESTINIVDSNNLEIIRTDLKLNQRDSMTIFLTDGIEDSEKFNLVLNNINKIGKSCDTYTVLCDWEDNISGNLYKGLVNLCDTAPFKNILLHITTMCCQHMNIKSAKKKIISFNLAKVKQQLKLTFPFSGLDINAISTLSDKKLHQSKWDIAGKLKTAIIANNSFDAVKLSKTSPDLLPNVLQGSKDPSTYIDDLCNKMAEIVIAVLKRYRKEVNLDFYTTIVEEIFQQLYPQTYGYQIWKRIKSTARTYWQPNDNEQTPKPGHQLIKIIKDFSDENGHFDINIICHSAGAIAGCELVKAIQKLKSARIRIGKIIFLAPACSFELFEEAIMGSSILREGFSMFVLKEEDEQKDIFIDNVYPRSFLQLASILENRIKSTPILGMERYCKKQPHISIENDAIEAFQAFREGSGNTRKVVYAGAPDCTAKRHDDFLTDEGTIDTIIQLLKNETPPQPLGALVPGNNTVGDKTNAARKDKHHRSNGRHMSAWHSLRQPNDNYLKIKVTRWKNKERKLKFSYTASVNGKKESDSFDVVHLLYDIKDYYNDSIKELEEAAFHKENLEEHLRRTGMKFYEELFPEGLRDTFYRLKDKVSTLIVDSFDEFIAWERCKMSWTNDDGTVQNGPFLCECFNMVRCGPLSLPVHIPLKNLAIIVPKSDLPNAQAEKEMLYELASKRSYMKITEIDPTVSKVINSFRAGEYDGFHFIGHIRSSEYANKYRMELNNGPVEPSHISGDARNLGRATPFVFLNSCYSAKTGLGLTNIGGWAAAFLRAGACCFIGSAFAVDDFQALKFATRFYIHLFSGCTVAEAAKHARLDIRTAGDPTWLYYAVYAHPFARLQEVPTG
ncbi:CHAT domain-containing protein [Chitinophaga filiformis]|uniref:CHAT domain-containing protein n=1 Tax=Chitinophaga filiformis TaxID=104663 RepID=A0ABY4I0T3_CHIFI|nr:CHAT domain-containing protein [Chitinophaga filiformis]UPK69693.1 CHAT domain-containing protein [Chitinophaga filiformis]